MEAVKAIFGWIALVILGLLFLQLMLRRQVLVAVLIAAVMGSIWNGIR